MPLVPADVSIEKKRKPNDKTIKLENMRKMTQKLSKNFFDLNIFSKAKSKSILIIQNI